MNDVMVPLDVAADAVNRSESVIHEWVRLYGITVACQRRPRRIVYSVRDLKAVEAAIRRARWLHLARCLTDEQA